MNEYCNTSSDDSFTRSNTKSTYTGVVDDDEDDVLVVVDVDPNSDDADESVSDMVVGNDEVSVVGTLVIRSDKEDKGMILVELSTGCIEVER